MNTLNLSRAGLSEHSDSIHLELHLLLAVLEGAESLIFSPSGLWFRFADGSEQDRDAFIIHGSERGKDRFNTCRNGWLTETAGRLAYADIPPSDFGRFDAQVGAHRISVDVRIAPRGVELHLNAPSGARDSARATLRAYMDERRTPRPSDNRQRRSRASAYFALFWGMNTLAQLALLGLASWFVSREYALAALIAALAWLALFGLTALVILDRRRQARRFREAERASGILAAREPLPAAATS